MKILVFYIIIIFLCNSLFASEPGNCSTFMLKTDSIFFVGHNLDESPELHISGLVCINKRNVYREGITWYELISNPQDYKKTIIPFEEKPDPKISWTSNYGSITFNIMGIDFPDGGINEKGLAIFEMSLGNTQYKYDKSNPTLFMVLWIQYLLDNFETVDQVIQTTNKINLQGWTWHFFVTDKNGDCAIIEFLNGEVVTHKNADVTYPVLCNTQYSQELKRVNNYGDLDGMWYKVINFIRTPPRFIRAVKILGDFDSAIHNSPKDYALNLLDEIKIQGWNKWGIVVDVKNKKIYFHTNRNRKLRYFSFKDFNFDNMNTSKILDIHADFSGEISTNFVNYTYERNYKLAKECADILFVERFKGLIDNGVTAEVYAKRFADYSKRMRNKKFK